ncbi:hypothetical protein JHK85_019042 [Glycine max]|nr:hypothetical protein JHK85_019042 [Glycine max]
MSGVKRALRQFTFGTGKTAGRNSAGRITSFHRGGGAKRLQRTVDHKRNTASSLGVVERIEYDPNRSSKIALVRWIEGVHHRRRQAASANAASPKLLHLDPAATDANSIRGVFALNSMLPHAHAGTSSRELFLSALASKAKGSESESVSSLGIPRFAVAAARAPFFAQRAIGEETLEVRHWRRNSDAWAHRNKRKAAISWQSIARRSLGSGCSTGWPFFRHIDSGYTWPCKIIWCNFVNLVEEKNINAMKKKYKKLKKQQVEELNQSSSLRKCCFSLMIGKVGATNVSVLRSVWQSFWLSENWDSDDNVRDQIATSLMELEEKFEDFIQKLKDAEWDTQQFNLKVPKEIFIDDNTNSL